MVSAFPPPPSSPSKMYRENKTSSSPPPPPSFLPFLLHPLSHDCRELAALCKSSTVGFVYWSRFVVCSVFSSTFHVGCVLKRKVRERETVGGGRGTSGNKEETARGRERKHINTDMLCHVICICKGLYPAYANAMGRRKLYLYPACGGVSIARREGAA